MNEARMEAIRSRLNAILEPTHIEVIDDSHLHVGHEGARDGRGHFTVRVVSEKFDGLRPLQRHQLIYDALGDLMTTDIHALRINAKTSAETNPTTKTES